MTSVGRSAPVGAAPVTVNAGHDEKASTNEISVKISDPFVNYNCEWHHVTIMVGSEKAQVSAPFQVADKSNNVNPNKEIGTLQLRENLKMDMEGIVVLRPWLNTLQKIAVLPFGKGKNGFVLPKSADDFEQLFFSVLQAFEPKTPLEKESIKLNHEAHPPQGVLFSGCCFKKSITKTEILEDGRERSTTSGACAIRVLATSNTLYLLTDQSFNGVSPETHTMKFFTSFELQLKKSSSALD